MKRMKVLLVDDHERFRRSIASFLNEQGCVDVVGEASNGDDAIAQTEKLLPDLVLMDVNIPNRSGIEVTRQIKLHSPKARVVILSMHGSDIYRRAATQFAADGFIDKNAMKEDLLAIITAGQTRPASVTVEAQ